MEKGKDIIVICGNSIDADIDYILEDWKKWKLNRLKCKNYRLKKKLENLENTELQKPIKKDINNGNNN